jgi:hypothetical protein
VRTRYFALLLVASTSCTDWREHVDPFRAAAEPAQAALDEAPIELSMRDHLVRLTPRASYVVTGYAADTSRKLLDEWDFVVPVDLRLALTRRGREPETG